MNSPLPDNQDPNHSIDHAYPMCSNLERYILGRMSLTEKEAFEDHLFDCATCRQEVLDEEDLKRFVMESLVPEVDRNRSFAWPVLTRLLNECMLRQPAPAHLIHVRNGIDGEPEELWSPHRFLCIRLSIDRPPVQPDRFILENSVLTVFPVHRSDIPAPVYMVICRSSDLAAFYREFGSGRDGMLHAIETTLASTDGIDRLIHWLEHSHIVKGTILHGQIPPETSRSTSGIATTTCETPVETIPATSTDTTSDTTTNASAETQTDKTTETFPGIARFNLSPIAVRYLADPTYSVVFLSA
ncbi:zf-HC2 domain-containing protein [bacterium]|nr:zf-HC2 domain-containing protein [candidate division CSSED10-310 bacterium]